MSEKRKEGTKAVIVTIVLVGFAITIAVMLSWWVSSLAGGWG